MNWRKIAMLSASLVVLGAGTAVSTTNAFAADDGNVLVTFEVFSEGMFIGEACAYPQPNGGEFCTGGIEFNEVQSRQFSVAPGTTVFVRGFAHAGFDKWREFKVGTGRMNAEGIAEEKHCHVLSGLSTIGFKFNEVTCP